ncbi:Uncharacterised protein [Bacillus tequilensis]|nr:Uncharacterised protein [Bacillus tequilensis]
MTFKKRLSIILGLSFVFLCGFGTDFTENQTQNTIHLASDRLQT